MTDETTEDEFGREFSPLLAGLAERRGECPDPERLAAYADGELAAGERAALDAHVGLCARCAADLELLAAAPAEVDDVTWRRAERGLDRRAAPWRPRAHSAAGTRRTAWLGVAAAVLAVAAGVAVWRLPVSDRGRTISTTRGHGLVAVAPAGEVRAVERFEWAAPPIEAKYRVEVRRGDERVLSAEGGPAPVAEIPLGFRDVLRPGVEYRWRVQAVVRDPPHGGERVVLESPWVEFRIVP
jgi:anti-sigma factor RsiW